MRRRWGAALLLCNAMAAAADFHLDCAGGNDSHDGRSPARAWRSIGHTNLQPLEAGDRLLLKRGTVCAGTLSPQGSGAPGRPIVLAAYGEGARPVVDGKGFDTAIRLWNQSHWLVAGVEARGSQVYGIFAGGNRGRIEGIELRDVVARDVHGALKTKNSGLIVVHATDAAVLDGILIDGALAESTTQWSGILVNGASGLRPPGQEQSRRVTVRNSIVRDVWGDGIILFQLQDGRVERSAAWKTGMQPRLTIGTPNGIWTWRCERCVVSESESFWSDSPGVDGGAFDIDWGNSDNTVERSYGHDTLSYCIAVFGAGKGVTTNSVIRGNVCAGLGRSPRLARHHGAIHLSTWDGGALDGVRIEDNIIEWHPQISEAVIRNDAVWRGAQEPVLRGNVIRWAEPPKSRRGALVFHLDGSADARGLRVLLESARVQYASKGVRIEERQGAPCVEYLGEDGKLVKSWQGYAPAAEVLWLVRQQVGEPAEW